MLARRERGHLLLIDLQEKLVPHVADQARVVANCARLVGYARRLGVPITVSEHMPERIGPTIADLVGLLGDGPRLRKAHFSCWRDADLKARIDALRQQGRREIVVAGMEAHVCVGQTVIDLLAQELDVFVVADAVGSRDGKVRDLALRRLEQAGAAIVSHEMIAF